MKKVMYNGELESLLPTLGFVVKKGDVIEVPDDFSNANFSDVKETPKKASKEETN